MSSKIHKQKLRDSNKIEEHIFIIDKPNILLVFTFQTFEIFGSSAETRLHATQKTLKYFQDQFSKT